MTAVGVHHHKIVVADLDRSLAFYRDILGFALVYDAFRDNPPAYQRIMGYPQVRVRIAMLQNRTGQSRIALLQFTDPEPKRISPEICSIGFSTVAVVVTDLDADYERLQRHNVNVISPPVQIIREGRTVATALYVIDPDGLPIELYQLHESAEDRS